MDRQEKWDRRYLELACFVAAWSKDPSTQTGAVIVRPNGKVASLGYNGFPQGTNDTPELYADRPKKYSRIIHCEMNAIESAKEPLNGYTLYTATFCSCDRCAAHVIQWGITRCVAPRLPDHLVERWGQSVKDTKEIFAEACVELKEYEFDSTKRIQYYRELFGMLPSCSA